MWALEIEPGSSGKATSAFNHGAISSSPLLFKIFKKTFYFTLCVFVWVMCICGYLQKLYLIPCAIAGGCELPDMGAGNQILLFRKSNKHL